MKIEKGKYYELQNGSVVKISALDSAGNGYGWYVKNTEIKGAKGYQYECYSSGKYRSFYAKTNDYDIIKEVDYEQIKNI